MKKATILTFFRSLGIVLCSFLFTLSSHAQDYTIQFLNESIELPENFGSFSWDSFSDQNKYRDGYYGWIQFYETPTQAEQNQLRAMGVELIDYIPNKAYLFYAKQINVQEFNNLEVRSIVPIEAQYKLSYDLKSETVGDWAIQGNSYVVNLVTHQGAKSATLDNLVQLGIQTNKHYKGADMLEVVVAPNRISDLASLPTVKWIEPIPQPGEPEDTRGRSLHKANTIDTQTATGRNYTGDGIGVMVRDDGVVGPHIDFQGRLDNSGASVSGPTHGDGVAGIMAGAGNLDPDKRGMAAGASVYAVNYVPSHLDAATTSLIESGDVVITNSSFSDGCNAGNTVNMRTVDTQANNYLSLLHVYSAGNSNGNECGYGAGTQWGNITGGHKQGKNVIATANVNFAGTLATSSSRGPAYDGRIKPDITANGQGHLSTAENNTYQTFGGTSGAAPGIAGVSAQLYEAYQGIYGTLPDASLIKATLLNTANDYGNVGPDFRFGWGIVNALRAAMLLEEGRFLSDEIGQGESNTHTITVPANTKQVRFMVYWNDQAAAAGVTPALVNDIDMTVNDPDSNTLSPWILDSTPNAGALNQPATNGEDHLNNMEQVLIDNPVAGDYTINLSGFNVPFGPQEYVVVYEVIAEDVMITYPFGGEKFTPGTAEVIRWDALPGDEDFLIEYSVDNGIFWNTIGTSPSTTRYRSWNVPASISGNCFVRITRGDEVSVHTDSFSIAERVSNVEIASVCPDTYTVTWNEVTGATTYDVYALGEKFMEVVGTVNTNTADIPVVDLDKPLWVAVVAKNIALGWESKRTIAVGGTTGLQNCVLTNDLAIEELNVNEDDFLLACDNQPVVVSADISNTGAEQQSNFMISYQLNDDPVVEEMYTETLASGELITFEFAEPVSITTDGDYSLKVWVTLDSDQNEFNDEIELPFYAFVNPEAINFVEGFEEANYLPNGWNIVNPDDGTTWEERSGIIGSDGNQTVSVAIDNFSYNAAGQEDVIATAIYDLENESNASLLFDIAKAQYSAQFTDSFRVDISTDCGDTFQEIYFETGLDLSTVAGYITSNWSPTSPSNWRTEIIDLSAYAGSNVVLRFVNINGYGNSTFIDNVALQSSLSVNDKDLFGAISMYPNPASDMLTIEAPAGTPISSVRIYNQLGQSVLEMANKDAQAILDLSNFASGLYLVSIEAEGQLITKKLIVD
ncbi:hypothetical protein GCM10009117_09500 [Gangjinia marincola]|uniref:Uncharacterized protein n=1 Tax=Gangjinia marincola TaxID=578463 RepID=A0ABP3XR83_9FLAO